MSKINMLIREELWRKKHWKYPDKNLYHLQLEREIHQRKPHIQMISSRDKQSYQVQQPMIRKIQHHHPNHHLRQICHLVKLSSMRCRKYNKNLIFQLQANMIKLKYKRIRQNLKVISVRLKFAVISKIQCVIQLNIQVQDNTAQGYKYTITEVINGWLKKERE